MKKRQQRKTHKNSPQQPLERLSYSLQEGADILGLSVFTLRRDARLGIIHTIHYGRRRLIPARELHRLAARGR